MVRNIDTAKRALVTLLKSLATIYLVAVGVTRESSDGDLRSAFRQVSRRAHPDRGGSEARQKSSNAAKDLWEEALKAGKDNGGDRKSKKAKSQQHGPLGHVHTARQQIPGFRFQGVGVLLTYQKFKDTGCWQEFLDFVGGRLVLWKVLYWCATMETNKAQRVAKAKFRNFKKVCKEVVRKKGAMSRQ